VVRVDRRKCADNNNSQSRYSAKPAKAPFTHGAAFVPARRIDATGLIGESNGVGRKISKRASQWLENACAGHVPGALMLTGR
jgi:hypothetical protein